MTAWAVIVGINTYAGLAPALQLHGAASDAADFAEWVLHADGGKVDPPHFYMWTYPPPPQDHNGPLGLMNLTADWPLDGKPDGTRAPHTQDIVALVERLQERVVEEADDAPHRIYVFFAGHGVQIAKVDGETCFVVGEYQGVANIGIIPCDSLRGSLQSNGFDEVILFLDCCRTPFDYRKSAPNFFENGNHQQVRHAVGRAAQGGKPAYEYPEHSPARGAFTKALTEALRRRRDSEGNLTLNDLETYLQKRVPGLVGSSRTQDPYLDQIPRPWKFPLLSGPVIDRILPIRVTNVQADRPLQLYDSQFHPFGQPASTTTGELIFQGKEGELYCIAYVGDPLPDEGFRNDGIGETHVAL